MEIDKVALIYIRNRKALAAVSKGKDVFYFPGGKREAGERDEETLTREIKEELCVDIIPESIEPYGKFAAEAHGKPKGTMMKMACYVADFIGEPGPGNEIESIIWVTSQDKDRTWEMGKKVLKDLKEKGLID